MTTARFCEACGQAELAELLLEESHSSTNCCYRALSFSGTNLVQQTLAAHATVGVLQGTVEDCLMATRRASDFQISGLPYLPVHTNVAVRSLHRFSPQI